MHNSCRNKSLLLGLIVAGVATFHSAEAQQVIFNNFGPGDTYNTGEGATVAGQNSVSGKVDSAMAFLTPATNDFFLDKIELAISLAGGPNELDVALMTNTTGPLSNQEPIPGDVIEMWHFTNAMGTFGVLNAPLVAPSILHPRLIADTPYWIAAFASTPDTGAAWNFTIVAPGFGSAQRTDVDWFNTGTDINITGAFRVTAAATPEPGLLTLLCSSGLLALGLRRHRQPRKQ